MGLLAARRRIADGRILANGILVSCQRRQCHEILSSRGPPKWPAQQIKPMCLWFFDLACHATGQLELGNDLWNIYDASADRLLLWRQYYHAVGSVEWGLSLLAADSRKIFQRMPSNAWMSILANSSQRQRDGLIRIYKQRCTGKGSSCPTTAGASIGLTGYGHRAP
jgi:hypothetical protein